jgi:hypothetical protein
MNHGMTMEEAHAMHNLVALVDSMSRMLTGLNESVIKLEGRELWMDNDGDIWHHHEGRMYPLTDEGEHVNVREMRHRTRAGDVMGMQRPDAFPTLAQVGEDQSGLLVRCTELDVVKRYVRRLEARLSELEG